MCTHQPFFKWIIYHVNDIKKKNGLKYWKVCRANILFLFTPQPPPPPPKECVLYTQFNNDNYGRPLKPKLVTDVYILPTFHHRSCLWSALHAGRACNSIIQPYVFSIASTSSNTNGAASSSQNNLELEWYSDDDDDSHIYEASGRGKGRRRLTQEIEQAKPFLDFNRCVDLDGIWNNIVWLLNMIDVSFPH